MDRVIDLDIEFTDDQRYFYRGQPFTGIIYECRDNGVLWSEFEVRDGIMHGAGRVYGKNGEVTEESYTRYGIHCMDLTRRWNESGDLIFEEFAEHGMFVYRKEISDSQQMEMTYSIETKPAEYEELCQRRKDAQRKFKQKWSADAATEGRLYI